MWTSIITFDNSTMGKKNLVFQLTPFSTKEKAEQILTVFDLVRTNPHEKGSDCVEKKECHKTISF